VFELTCGTALKRKKVTIWYFEMLKLRNSIKRINKIMDTVKPVRSYFFNINAELFRN